MTFHRPIQKTCSKGHQRKQVTTTGAWFCPECQKENKRKLADKKRADRIRQRITPLYT